MLELLKSSVLLIVLLNPFLLVIYLLDVIEKLDQKTFRKVVIRAGLIATFIFCIFAILGDTIFTDLFQSDFASFQIFGGIVFFLIGLQFVFHGPNALELLRGESEHLAGAIAMPILIGPGTISASVIIGEKLPPIEACIAVFFSVMSSIIIVILLKSVHDFVKKKHEPLIQRYIEIAGRITSFFIGTFAIEMIIQGIRTWSHKF